MRDPESRTQRNSAEIIARLAVALAGRYTIEREIGRGGMATVYRALDLRHDRPVALKVLVPSITNAMGAERFLREIHIAAALTHPHILTVHDSGDASGLLYYVMPFVTGESLRQRLDREHQLPIDDSVRITREVADALAYAHGQGVVHRDIKPENILLAGGHALVADFGIARAISTAAGGERRLTDSGISLGTPLYMSPEQAAGEHDIDGRADLYALGCVCFEMLTGVPPYSGANAQTVRMRHVLEPPPPIRTMRPTVPVEIEEIVHRMMAKVPADRFDTAERLVALLPGSTTERAAFVAPHPRLRRRRWWMFGAMGALVVAIAALALGIPAVRSLTSFGGVAPDSTRYAVLPLKEDGTLPDDLSGTRLARDMADALGHWRGIDVVRDFRVRDLLDRAERPPTTMRAIAGIARQLRAGIVVWGDVRPARGGADVRAVMYRSTDPDEILAEQAVFVPAGGAVRDSLAVLAAGLLTTREGATRQASGTTDLNAYAAFSRANDALGEWDFATAIAEFSRAIEIDHDYADAHLWLALVLTWAGRDDSGADWRVSARRAAELANELPARDRPYATALAAMADGRTDIACARFDSLVRADSTSFEAWFGLGTCLQADTVVLRDRRSPSGYAFRTSWERAITAYMTALELVPSAHRAFRGAAFDRLRNDMLFATPNFTRAGVFQQGGDTSRFFAFAALDGDTIAYTPYPPRALFSGSAGPSSAAVAAAAGRNRQRLRSITARWVAAFPNSADAREAFARALEGLGEIDESQDEPRSALLQLRKASRGATEPSQLLRLAIAEVRLLLKTEQFSAAARLADSLLASAPAATGDALQFRGLSSLAALRGDAARAAELLKRAAPAYAFTTPFGNSWSLDRPLAEPALAYLAYAAIGAPADTLRAKENEVRRALDQFASGPRHEEFTLATLLRPAQLAFPITGATWAHGLGPQSLPLLSMQQQLLAGDTAGLRARLNGLDADRAAFRPGDVSIDETYQEAELRLAIGDTAAALAMLDRQLMALPTLGFELVGHVSEAAALVRSMALRDTLARRAGDARTAQRWHAAVAALRGAVPPATPGGRDD